ncbi:MAG: sulfite exporter TauE/SafE family protein [Salinarimonadaceae bacterium]|nr:MAG: sulfite exporter TauE/SafE family protein [Salinarimonadaceae bacterium]
MEIGGRTVNRKTSAPAGSRAHSRGPSGAVSPSRGVAERRLAEAASRGDSWVAGAAPRVAHRTRPLDIETAIIVILALALGGFVKGATGLGLPLVTIPVLASFLGLPHALALMQTPLIVTNVWQIWQYRRANQGAYFLRWMLPMGALGVGGGTWLLISLPATALSLMLAGMVALYVILNLARPDMLLPAALADRLAPAAGLAGGVLQGATGIAAPIIVTFIHAMRLPRENFVFALSAMFVVFSITHATALTVVGVLTFARVLEGALALIPIALAMPVGAWAATRCSRRAFERAILLLLVMMAARLLQTGLGF